MLQFELEQNHCLKNMERERLSVEAKLLLDIEVHYAELTEVQAALVGTGYAYLGAGTVILPSGLNTQLTPQEDRFFRTLTLWKKASHRTLARSMGYGEHLHPVDLTRVWVRRLREKLNDSSGEVIKTVRNYGYKFAPLEGSTKT